MTGYFLLLFFSELDDQLQFINAEYEVMQKRAEEFYAVIRRYSLIYTIQICIKILLKGISSKMAMLKEKMNICVKNEQKYE